MLSCFLCYKTLLQKEKNFDPTVLLCCKCLQDNVLTNPKLKNKLLPEHYTHKENCAGYHWWFTLVSKRLIRSLKKEIIPDRIIIVNNLHIHTVVVPAVFSYERDWLYSETGMVSKVIIPEFREHSICKCSVNKDHISVR